VSAREIEGLKFLGGGESVTEDKYVDGTELITLLDVNVVNSLPCFPASRRIDTAPSCSQYFIPIYVFHLITVG
jgi:hypothetical protein